MAELIDKGALVESMKRKDAENPLEHPSWYDALRTVYDMPTVTEADIRAKVIDEFAEKFIYKVHCEGCSGCTNCYETGMQYICDTYRYYAEVAEQLKGE